MGDVIQRAAGLRAIHQRRSATQELDAIDRIERRRVIRLGIPELIRVNGESVLEHLGELGPVRRQAAIANAHQRTGFLTQQQARGLRQRLAIIVVADLRQFVEIQDRRLFARVDPGLLNIRQKRALHGFRRIPLRPQPPHPAIGHRGAHRPPSERWSFVRTPPVRDRAP
jgi:hypothetical protein